MSGITRLATVTASTKRRPVISGGIIGVPTTKLASVKVTPFQPVSAEIAARNAIGTPHETLQTFVDGAPDIVEGDILVVGSKEYPIKSVENWSSASIGRGSHLLILVEDLKR